MYKGLKLQLRGEGTPEGAGSLPKWTVVPDDDALRCLDVPRMLIVKALKTALQSKEARVLPIPSWVFEALSTMPKETLSGLVFPARNGKQHCPGFLRKPLMAVTKHLGLHTLYLGLHTLW